MTVRRRVHGILRERVRVVRAVELTEPGRLLAGKTVFVTGAGANIGRATAVECASQGAEIIALDRDGDAAQETARRVRGTAVQADVTDRDRIAEVVSALPAIDVLVNNVGIGRSAGIVNLHAEDWRATFDTNVLGPMWLTHLCVPKMPDSGAIVMVSSIHEAIPRGDAAYGASKAAVAALVKELALELAPRGIRVNAVAPGSSISDDRGAPLPDSRATLHQATVPPEYVGRAVVFLASDYFSLHTTGSTVTVDAGLSLLTESRIRR